MKVKLTIICCIVVILAIIIFNKIYTNLAYVKLEKIDEIETENDYGEEYWKYVMETPYLFGNRYWSMLTESNRQHFNIPKYNELNLKENNYVLSYGREIKEIKYKRDMRFPLSYSNYTTTVFKKEIHPHTMFIYKIDKSKEVWWDEKGNILVDVKIEEN